MLVKHPERRRVHDAVAPGQLDEFGIALEPQQRIALAVDRVHMRAGGVAVRLLVAAGRNFRGVRVHRAVGEDERHVLRALAALVEIVELEAREIVDEIGLPHVQRRDVHAAVEGGVFALPLEVLRHRGPLGKREGVVEDEIEIVIKVDRHRRVVGARQPRTRHAG